MWHWNNDWLMQARQKDLLHEAEQRHLLRLVLAQRQPTTSYYAPVLVWFGRQLSGWGAWLQARYAPLDWCGEACNVSASVSQMR